MKKHDLLQTWAVKHNDIQVRMSSRSGGIFTALSDRILEQNGVVYGAKLSDDCRSVQHERATTFKERNSFRGSKYIQSRLQIVGELQKICLSLMIIKVFLWS